MPNTLRIADDYNDYDLDHPLEGVESLLEKQSHTLALPLSFQRITDDELFIEYRGRFGLYRMIFVWNSELGAMQFCSQLDVQITNANTDKALRAVAEINTGLWIGHFDLPPENNIPTYRHTQLLRDNDAAYGLNYVADMLGTAVGICDKHYATFMTLSDTNMATSEDLFFAMMPAVGQCN